MFVADDLAAWLVGLLADAGRRRLSNWVLGNEQERALRQAAMAAVRRTAVELRPADGDQVEELVIVISQVFGEPDKVAPLFTQATFLEGIRATVAAQLSPLDDANLTGTGKTAAEVLGVSAPELADTLTSNLVQELIERGARGGVLAPLAAQLNHDATHMQGRRLEDMVGRLAAELREGLAQLSSSRVVATPVALAQLPLPVAGFSGRDGELAWLARLLQPIGAGVPVVVSAVSGLAGVGKTTLAVEAGHLACLRGWFPGGVLFIDLHGYDERRVEPSQALEAFLRALGVAAEHIPLGAEERAGLYRSVLAQISEPLLIVADNASSEAQVRLLLPGIGPHKVMVTSRHTLAGLGARLVDVTVLDEATSADLLNASLRVARPDDDRISSYPQDTQRLARLCGGLPLALQICAALLKSDLALSTAELAAELSREQQRLARLSYDDGGATTGLSVAVAFELSYRKVGEHAARIFRLLPVNPGPDVSTAAVAVLADLSEVDVRTLLESLARAHLVDRSPGTMGRWRMHDLVRLYAERLSDEHAAADDREQARDRMLSYYLCMARAADKHLQVLPGMTMPLEFDGQDAALAWLDAERTSLLAAIKMAADTDRDQVAIHLPLALSSYFDMRRIFDDCLTAMTISLNAARNIGDRSSEGVALNTFAHTLWSIRRADQAIIPHQNALVIFREIGDRFLEATALINLGSALLELRRYDEALSAQQDALTISREISDHRLEANALICLGNVQLETQRIEEAVITYRDCLAVSQQIGYRRGEAMALTNIGLALLQLKRLEEAISTMHEAAHICREIGNRNGEGMVVSSLGTALRESKRVDEAIATLHDAVEIFRETRERYLEADAMSDLGLTFREAGLLDDAIAAYKEANAIFHDIKDLTNGAPRRREGEVLENLATVLHEAGRTDEAVIAYQDAAAILRETGNEEPGTL